MTAADFLAEVRGVAKGLVAAGIGPGDRVGLVSRTRYEWTLVDYAVWYVGAATVPVYETSSAEQVEWILSDSGARAAVVESSDHLSRVNSVRQGLDELRHAWSLDDNAVDVLTALGSRRDATTTSRPGAPRSPPSPPRRSSTRRAPPGDPRAACSPTATS